MNSTSSNVRAPIQLSGGFVVPEQVLCHATSLRKATRRISQMYDVVLAPCGLRSTQRSILMQIARSQVPSMSELAAALVLDRSALAHNLKPLERDGFVSVEIDPNDRRSRLVKLTSVGEAKLIESQALWLQAQACFESVLGAEKASDLRASLASIASGDYLQELAAD
ncbi:MULTISPECIES: MarR family winged helix-turn-helix transcriptional regulator [unclassified Pseudomonas]|uniref:MarR family winged helix-turn-helix transcriptional regulator n=1 Tax=unclassified Pseudomonas TaxID=196821 RepID=UPI002ACB12AD|nr:MULTISPECIES: MarR family winged helix-turn-helix transcriptional regulator [unclassified Pseudomonas]MEB0042425.1 MarR family winged helix-turn-helix transcriptional regulator [Pseudomonas sp. MH10]MEB0092402.1 MarR family winged helix-turn-helix transcriptional regulator [Pseudomonas sp. CCI4.2]MEB0122084.1 MarR family winged helix-turn-helix transcriptional regulator [Pseudomonas sp. CCI1.2]WPX52076.1 MarR family winged helix-turn-helix transcriptional regulator [Pseudomonas sp. CCI4.2]W